MRYGTFTLLSLLAACGRPAGTDADVKLVGVGNHPDEIGPSPTPYGGVVEYDHVDFGGAGLPIALMGLSGTEPVGPQMVQFEPPYEGVFAFSYLFDTKLRAADTLAQIGAAPPVVEGTCYTAFQTQGPIGAFTTVDAGDYMDFSTGEAGYDDPAAAGMRLNRFPRDYPANAQDVFIYYIGFSYFRPEPLTHKVPDPAFPDDPTKMIDQTYRKANYPFGQELQFSFPGGFARQDQIVSSIPMPSKSAADNRIKLPDPLGGVKMSWVGPRYDAAGELIEDGEQHRCFEFYEGRPNESDLTVEDCASLYPTPTSASGYASFDGQMYTGPWDTEGGVTFEWAPSGEGGSGDQIVLTVRFLAPTDTTDPSLAYVAVPDREGGFRPARTCEEGSEDADLRYDEEANGVGEDRSLGLKGDPQSQLATVTCLLPDTGSFTLTEAHLARALEHIELNPPGAEGVVFFFSRGNEVEAIVPAAKDQYDQRRDITPVLLTARSVRIGRFQWNEAE